MKILCIVIAAALLSACAARQPPCECCLLRAETEIRLLLRERQVQDYWRTVREIEYRENILNDWRNHGIRPVYP